MRHLCTSKSIGKLLTVNRERGGGKLPVISANSLQVIGELQLDYVTYLSLCERRQVEEGKTCFASELDSDKFIVTS